MIITTRALCDVEQPLAGSVYKSVIGHHFLEFWVEMTEWLWRSRSMTPIFNTAERILVCIFRANLLILTQIRYKLSRGQAAFPRIMSKNGQMTLKIKANDPHVSYQLWVSQHACLVQIWWLQLKSVTSYCAENFKFTERWTNRRTGGQTAGRRQWQYPFGLKSQGVKAVICR